MILMKNHSAIIATPTKCGTKSLEALLIEKLRVGELLHERHRMTTPDGLYTPKPGVVPKRLLLVRRPDERIASAWRYISTYRQAWCWARDRCDSFEEWVRLIHRLWLDANTHTDGVPGTYCLPCADLAKTFRPDGLLRLETIQDDLKRHLDIETQTMPHRNTSRDKTATDAMIAGLSGEARAMLEAWCAKDLALTL